MSLKNAVAHSSPYLEAAKALKDNPGQWNAYESTGSCVILAGPGSGKTKTITIKIARMLAEDIRVPRGVACITYNTQCARELKKRLSLLGVEDGQRISISTLHSFCLKHIVTPYAQLAKVPKKYPITVASARQVAELQKKAIDSVLGRDIRWPSSFDRYRRKYLDRSTPEWETDEETAKVIKHYEKLLDEKSLIDFDGMVLLGFYLIDNFEWVRKSLAARFPVLVVDEYQDLGYGLDHIVRSLCFKAKIRLIAVGDPDQSIYGFNGAEPSLLLNLSTDPRLSAIRLNLNYRCGSNIIRASEVALGEARGFKAHEKSAPGEIFLHEVPEGAFEQAKHICENIIPKILERREARTLGDIAILYQDKNEGDIIALAVQQTGWKFIRVDGNNPYQPSPVTYWLEDCAAWCAGQWKTAEIRLSELIRRWLAFNQRLLSEDERRIARVQLVKFLYENRTPNASLNDWLKILMKSCLQETLSCELLLLDDKEKVEKLLAVTAVGKVLSEFTVAFFAGQGGSPDHINLTTRHSAKGLEYDAVIMPGLEDGKIPFYKASDEEIRESRRLFYVSLTRARHEVHLVYSGWYENGYGKFSNGPSRFVAEVKKDISL